jgi:nucleoside-diphosphate-sugar epimerase
VPLWLLRWMSPYMANFFSMRAPLSNAKARAELHWRPAYPSWQEGLRQTLQHAA